MEATRILLVEDDPLDAELLYECLRVELPGCELVRVDDRQQFEAKLREGAFRLVLADYSLPGFDGLTALRLTRELDPELPFIFVSGAIGEEGAIETLREGATDYVLKDRLERLPPAVARALHEADERRDRRLARDSLRESEERFRLLVDNVRDHAIVQLDLGGHVVSWNEGAERILRYTAAEIIGRHFSCFYPKDAREKDVPEKELKTARRYGRGGDDTWLVRKGGRRFWASGVTTPLHDEDGKLRGFVKVLRDMTERKRLQEALEERAEQLAEADRRKDRFLAILSHELRNPLGAILAATRVLEQDHLDNRDRNQARDVIVRQARHMSRLLDDLLDVSRVSQNKIDLRRKVFDLTTTVSAAVEAVQPLIDERELLLSVEVDDGPLCVDGDAARLQQVQVNLLTNAVKYTPPGENIQLTMTREQNQAVIRVRDTGVGIPRDMLETIFEMFVQSDETLDRSEGGIGIGLTLVRFLVEMHGGTVSAHSAGIGEGSAFVVRLPLAQGACPEPVPDAERPVAAGKLKVLIVEDNSDAREMLKTLLELDGYDVRVAGDGPAGLAAVERERPDVALVDIGLPGIDGYQIARRLRADSANDNLLLIALTGYGRSSDRQRAFEAGFDEHLVKPLQPDELTRILAARGERVAG